MWTHPIHLRTALRWICAGLLLAVLALTVIPSLVPARTVKARNGCLANLKQIEGAKETWALEFNKKPADIPLPEDLYGETNYIRETPTCPQGGTYTIGSVGETPKCSLAKPGHQLDQK